MSISTRQVIREQQTWNNESTWIMTQLQVKYFSAGVNAVWVGGFLLNHWAGLDANV